MAARPKFRGLPWWWAALPGATVAFAGVGSITLAPLPESGLAFIVVATLGALFLGAPLARLDWLDDAAEGRGSALRSGFADVAIWGSLSALCTADGLEMREIAILAILCVLACFSSNKLAEAVSWLALAAPLAIALDLALIGGPPGWTLLEPDLRHLMDWAPFALGTGLLIGWAPTYWSRTVKPTPGRTLLPFSVTGLGVLGMLGLAWARATLHERHLGDPPALVLPSLLAPLALLVLVQHRPTRARVADLVLFGCGLLWFSLGGLHTYWWSALLPLLLGLALAADLLDRRRPRLLATAFILFVSLLLADLEHPSSVLLGLVGALPLLAGSWIGGTRALLVGRSA